jgi:HPt (histidine-containing phosphotransfer) domain-containing protein
MPEHPAPTTDDRAALIAALSPALDAQALGRLADLDPDGRGGLLRRVLLTYEQSLRRLAEQFERARAGGDSDGLRQVAHTLKSSSASVGATVLAASCAEIERRLRDGEAPAELAAELDTLSRASREVLAALAALARGQAT